MREDSVTSVNRANSRFSMTIAESVNMGEIIQEEEVELLRIDRDKMVKTFISNFIKLYFD